MHDGWIDTVPTSLGVMGLRWMTGDGAVRLREVLLPGRTELKTTGFGTKTVQQPPVTRVLAEALKRRADGMDAPFDTDMLYFGRAGRFRRSVWGVLPAISRGMVISYSDLAGRAGRPGASRAAGAANAANPFPVLAPCHRVVGSDGALRGFAGGIPMKRALLEREGIVFDQRGRVDPAHIKG